MNEQTYRVVSDRLPHPQGSTVTPSDLPGGNIDALVAAGHLVPATQPRTTKSRTHDDDSAIESQE